MGIDRDDGDHGRTPVDRMIDEFRAAQSRRLAKATAVRGDDRVGEPPRMLTPWRPGSTATLTSHSND